MNIDNDGTKPYKIKRGTNKNYANDANIISYADNREIKIFVLYHKNDKKQVQRMEIELENKKIMFTNGVEETELAFEEKVDVINNFDYLVVIVSESLLNDLELLDILESNYSSTSKNEKIVPIIIGEKLYEPEKKSNIIKKLKERIIKFKEECFDDDFTGSEASELRRMQKILRLLQSFLGFATSRDRKRSLRPAQKLVQYIEHHRKEKIPEKSKTEKDSKNNNIVNNFNIENVDQLNVGENIHMT